MYKIKIAVVLVLSVCTILPGCRKADNDPFISLRSRKARLCGEWKVTSGSGTSTEIAWSGSSTTATWTFDGSQHSTKDQFGNVTTVPRTIEYSFSKEGTFTMKETDNGTTYSIEGRWDFNGGEGEAKSKTEVVLFYTKVTEGGTTSIYTGYTPMHLFKLTELRSKKMVFEFHDNITYYWGDKSNYSESWVLEAK
jgi:hypothetical protein